MWQIKVNIKNTKNLHGYHAYLTTDRDMLVAVKFFIHHRTDTHAKRSQLTQCQLYLVKLRVSDLLQNPIHIISLQITRLAFSMQNFFNIFLKKKGVHQINTTIFSKYFAGSSIRQNHSISSSNVWLYVVHMKCNNVKNYLR